MLQCNGFDTNQLKMRYSSIPCEQSLIVDHIAPQEGRRRSDRFENQLQEGIGHNMRPVCSETFHNL